MSKILILNIWHVLLQLTGGLVSDLLPSSVHTGCLMEGANNVCCAEPTFGGIVDWTFCFYNKPLPETNIYEAWICGIDNLCVSSSGI